MFEIFKEVTQGTEEWHKLRDGKVTASESAGFESLMSTRGATTGLLKVGAKTRIIKAVAEQFGYKKEEDPKKTGLVCEEKIIKILQKDNNKIKTVGFVGRNEYIGCSPDYLEMDGDKIIGGGEIKTIDINSFLEFLDRHEKDGTTKYDSQVQFCLWITQAPVWHLHILDLWKLKQIEADERTADCWLKCITKIERKPDLELHKKFEENEKIFIEECKAQEERYNKHYKNETK